VGGRVALKKVISERKKDPEKGGFLREKRPPAPRERRETSKPRTEERGRKKGMML